MKKPKPPSALTLERRTKSLESDLVGARRLNVEDMHRIRHLENVVRERDAIIAKRDATIRRAEVSERDAVISHTDMMAAASRVIMRAEQAPGAGSAAVGKAAEWAIYDAERDQ